MYFSDYIYYLHEPYEEEHLLMSIYPYEVPLHYLDSNNQNGVAGGSIMYKKEIIRKISVKGECQEITMERFVGCFKSKLRLALEKSNEIKCIVPTLNFTGFDIPQKLEYCKTEKDALAVNTLIYELAQKTHQEHLCQQLCNRTVYFRKETKMSKNVLVRDLKEYGGGYYKVWMFYTNMYVIEKIETNIYDFDTTVVAVGGSIGLFLGWS